MDLANAIRGLTTIYDAFEAKAQPYRSQAVCRPGCAFCCTHYGSLDIVTLEGAAIRAHLQRMPRAVQTRLKKRITRNRRLKESGQAAACPFLNANDTCGIYAVRPFSCRQLYSVRTCGPGGPVIHRRAVALAAAAVGELQQLDATGYSGHLTFILEMLDSAEFDRLYRGGGFAPETIRDYGKVHGIRINRMACGNAGGGSPPGPTPLARRL